ncbi:hypothetical protein FS749_009475 [Ceratobasidium sp. UAMH 11750]|nr:hypothetical protein FS749_009475 [Ceratobasidium sp. UAMH 11750]
MFQHVHLGSVATPADVPLSNPIGAAPPFETAPRLAEKPVRAKQSQPSHGSPESFEFMSPNEEDLQRFPMLAALSGGKKLRRQMHTTRMPPGPTSPAVESTNAPTPNGSAAEVHLPRVKSAERVAQSVETSSGLIEEEVLAAAEAAVNANANVGPKSTQPELDRGHERERGQKPKVAEPKVKVEARKQQNSEGDVFKAMQERLRKAEEHKPRDFARKAEQAATSRPGYADCIPHGRLGQTGDSEPTETRVPKIYTPTRVRTPSPRSQLPVAHGSPSSIDHPTLLVTHPTGHEAASSILKAVTPEPAPKPRPTPTAHSAPRPPAGRQRNSGSGSTLHPERPKSAAPSPGLAVPPHVNTSTSPSDANHEQEHSPMNVKTPRASGFHPERTPRAPACPVPEPSSQPDMSPPPRVYVSPNQTRARAEEESSKRRVYEEGQCRYGSHRCRRRCRGL